MDVKEHQKRAYLKDHEELFRLSPEYVEGLCVGVPMASPRPSTRTPRRTA